MIKEIIMNEEVVYNMSILITYIGFVLLMPIIRLAFSNKYTKWGERYWLSYLLTIIIMGIIVGFMILQPEKFGTWITNITNST
jgi:UPF0716 family protein affecting phage T7 exclusion